MSLLFCVRVFCFLSFSPVFCFCMCARFVSLFLYSSVTKSNDVNASYTMGISGGVANKGMCLEHDYFYVNKRFSPRWKLESLTHDDFFVLNKQELKNTCGQVLSPEHIYLHKNQVTRRRVMGLESKLGNEPNQSWGMNRE